MSKEPKEYQPRSQNFHETKPDGPNISPGEVQHMPPAFGMNTVDPTELGHPEQPPVGGPLNRPAPGEKSKTGGTGSTGPVERRT